MHVRQKGHILVNGYVNYVRRSGHSALWPASPKMAGARGFSLTSIVISDIMAPALGVCCNDAGPVRGGCTQLPFLKVGVAS